MPDATRKSSAVVLTLLVLCLAWLPSVARADGWEALRQPDTFAIMRHALAPGTSDPENFRLGDCETQRNLDDSGRNQARMIGAEFRARGIVFDQVMSSQWCRTLETASLLESGPVAPLPALNSFFEDRSTREDQTRALLAFLDDATGKTMLVTHQVNISALTGRSTLSGEVLVVRLSDTGAEVIDSILIDP